MDVDKRLKVPYYESPSLCSWSKMKTDAGITSKYARIQDFGQGLFVRNPGVPTSWGFFSPRELSKIYDRGCLKVRWSKQSAGQCRIANSNDSALVNAALEIAFSPQDRRHASCIFCGWVFSRFFLYHCSYLTALRVLVWLGIFQLFSLLNTSGKYKCLRHIWPTVSSRFFCRHQHLGVASCSSR